MCKCLGNNQLHNNRHIHTHPHTHTHAHDKRKNTWEMSENYYFSSRYLNDHSFASEYEGRCKCSRFRIVFGPDHIPLVKERERKKQNTNDMLISKE